jgi:SM-20-related protein
MIYEEAQWLEWMDTISDDDLVVIDDFLAPHTLEEVHTFFDTKIEKNGFRKATIGADHHAKSEIRGDHIYWLDPKIDLDMSSFFDISDEMIQGFNRYCYLSLKASEFHLASYPIGSFYKQHVDQIEGSNNRVITILLYLNKDYQTIDEGALRVHGKDSYQDIAPINNRCVIFKSDKILHEVLVTKKIRRSLTGWLLYNPSSIDQFV